MLNALVPFAEPPARPAFQVAEIALLERLRAIAGPTRCAARFDPFRACALLSGDPNQASIAYAEGLLRALRQSLGRAPVIYAPGTSEISDDEAWLLRALLSAASGDEDSLRFLVERRIGRSRARAFLFFTRNLAARLDTL